MQNEILTLMDEIVLQQEKRLLKLGREIRPNLTSEDVLQPNDYPELENHPEFRYEEGVLEGLKTMQMALTARYKENTLRASISLK